MAPYLYYICYIATLLLMCTSQWISSSKTLPAPDSGMAIGSYNHSIFYLGGRESNRQLVEYDIDRDEIHDSGAFAVSGMHSESTYYTQMNHVLFIIDLRDTLTTYDMKTRTFNDNYAAIDSKVGAKACLASKPGYLYIVGGFNRNTALNSLQVFDITNNTWIGDISPMNNGRINPSCIVNPSTGILYAFSGYVYSGSLPEFIHSTEAINTTDVTQHTWSYIESLALNVSSFFYPVVYDNKIYVLGARIDTGRGPPYVYYDTVFIMDLIMETLSISPDLLWDFMCCAAPIIVDDILYSFGGSNNGAYDYVRMLQLTADIPSATSVTSHPIASPTKAPNRITTTNPSVMPSNTPSADLYNITAVPTLPPLDSSTAPTNTPSNVPSLNPSIAPESQPTSSRNQNPTITTNTTLIPSNTPTDNPLISSSTELPTNMPVTEGTDAPLTATHSSSTALYPTDGTINIFTTESISSSDIHTTTEYNTNIVDATTDIDKEWNEDEIVALSGAIAAAVMIVTCVYLCIKYKKEANKRKELGLFEMQRADAHIAQNVVVIKETGTVEGVHDEDDACTMIKHGTGTDHHGPPNTIIEKDLKNLLEVQSWLVNVVEMPYYYNTFVQNGYESLDIIKQIGDNVELTDIGITDINHQTRILKEIVMLQGEQDHRLSSDNACGGGTEGVIGLTTIM